MKKTWDQIEISNGSGRSVLEGLQLLSSRSEKEQQAGYWKVQNAVVLQSDLYEGAYYVIEPLSIP